MIMRCGVCDMRQNQAQNRRRASSRDQELQHSPPRHLKMKLASDPAGAGRARVAWLDKLVWLAALFTVPAHAQRAWFEMIEDISGAAPSGITGMVQDAQGFIWIARNNGLWRYDGRNFVHWEPERFSDPVYNMVQSPGGDIVMRTFSHLGYIKQARKIDPLPGPDAKPVTNLNHMAFDAMGRLWCVLGAQLWRRERDGRWTEIPNVRFGAEKPQRVSALEEGIGVMTDAGAWVLRDDRPGEKLVASNHMWAMAGGGAYPIWMAEQFCTRTRAALWRWHDGAAHPVACEDGRVMDMQYRHDTLWLSIDNYLVAYEPDNHKRIIGTKHGLISGGPLLIDREESLWVATFGGIAHFPEPDTWFWDQAEGLPAPFGYWIEYGAHRIWVSIWGFVLASFAEDGSDLRVATELKHYGVPCADARDRIWATDRENLWRSEHGDAFHQIALPSGPTGWLDRCFRDADGTLWMLMRHGTYRLAPDADLPERILATNSDDEFSVAWPGEQNTLWFAKRDQACHFRRDAGLTALGCLPLPLSEDSRPLGALPVGPDRVWLSCGNCALDLHGSTVRALPSNHIAMGAHFLPARSGGNWMTGRNLSFGRIRLCKDCTSEYELLERPGRWQGVPSGIDGWAVETPRGDLWINSGGVYRIPAAARTQPTVVPRIEPVSAKIDGVSQGTLDAPLHVGVEQHNIELEFSALTFRDRNLLRYRWRVHDTDDWSAARDDARLQLIDLAHGEYQAQMQASLDGEHWSAPAAIDFVVATPWYRTPWANAMFVLLGMAMLAWAYRLRIASILRIERERTRIAMDLHDDIGSGLGAIGMLASMAARSETASEERQRAAMQIAQTTSLLGGGLRTLVWSMKVGQANLAGLATQLADHARRLFADSNPRLSVALPHNYPEGVVAPDVRRHVLLIALEALHNAARHAKANRVSVRLAPDGERWLLEIADDGIGFDPTTQSGGNGLDSMRRRARLIGAELEFESMPATGTNVRLHFSPFAPVERSRIFMRLRRRRTMHKLKQ